MKYQKNTKNSFRVSLVTAAIATVFVSAVPQSVFAAEETPPGYHRMPDGRIMANNPATAIAPQGYHLMPDGTLMSNNPKPAADADAPSGFYRMPDGTLMADDPSSAVAPPGYHMMPDGTLMSNGGGGMAAPIEEVPDGFHRMPDGTLMANDPANAVAPPGYHMMPDGTLMSGGGSGDHSHHNMHGGGHMHGKGMFMAQYKYQRMYMKDLMDSDNKLTAEIAVDNRSGYPDYMMAPVDMTMDMHMLMLMYGVTDSVMLMAMGHYMSSTMGMLSDEGSNDATYVSSVMKSSGIADTVLSAFIKLSTQWNAKIGWSIPTGSINVRGPMTHSSTFTEQGVKYPYGMQLGSGTHDLIPGISYADASGKINWKVDFDYTLRIGKNDSDYKRGNKLELKSQLGWDASKYFSVHGKLDLRSEGQIDGSDKDMNAGMSPAADAQNYGGIRLDTGLGVKLNTADKMWGIGADFVMPVYQNLWGPQMRTSWIGGVYIDFMFM